jgi:predicted amidohydrolase
VKLALAQLDVRGSDVAGNVDRAERRIEQAAAEGADLVVLPEIFNVGYFAFESYARQAEAIDGPTLTTIANAAADHDVGVLAGSIVEDLDATPDAVSTPAETGYANTSVLFDRDGSRRLVYRKHHLFGYGSAEQELLTPGKDVSVAPFEEFTVGVTTCYDLRFPELYRRLTDAGATLVLVPSAWPYPRVEHWTLLPRARAIENLAYVAAVNGTGEFEDAELLGRSSVYDPWGTVLARTGDEPDLVTARIDADRVDRVREEFPALEDRR